MATKKATKKPTKTSFVLSLPRDLPAAEVVDKAKVAGVKLTENYVHKIRSKAKAGGGKKKTSAKTKTAPRKKAGKLSASDFIRQHPSKSANEVVELGKKKGLKFTISSVYQCRSYDKKKGGTSKTKGKPGPKTKDFKFQVFPGGGGGGSDSDLKKAALAVGFPRALTVVTDLAKKFEAVQRQYQALLA